MSIIGAAIGIIAIGAGCAWGMGMIGECIGIVIDSYRKEKK